MNNEKTSKVPAYKSEHTGGNTYRGCVTNIMLTRSDVIRTLKTFDQENQQLSNTNYLVFLSKRIEISLL